MVMYHLAIEVAETVDKSVDLFSNTIAKNIQIRI
jgi:hypothetical protein